MGRYKTTKKHLKIFIEECLKWIDFFGLKGWEAEFKHKKSKDSYGGGYLWTNAMACEIYLSSSWPEKPTEKQVRNTAKHEIAHLLLRPVVGLASEMYSYEGMVESREHEIINKIMGLME
jgi:predicted SprT family Zn-dependent metalloprotease